MKTAIVYASVHHGNTKKIIDEIAKTNDVELIDATQTVEKDLSEYDLIGFASGVYGGKFHQSVLKFASVNLTDNKNVFLICTYGGRPVFKSIEHLEQAIVDYINYYNNKRIKIKLKGLSPVQYRTKSFA